ncbi:hypothetical protein V8C26DRAFT_424608 [Trichoderma gracile]
MASRSEWLQIGAEGAAGEWCEQRREVACTCVRYFGFVPSMAPCHGSETGKSRWTTIHGTARGAPSRVQAWVEVPTGIWEPELDKLQGMPWQWADSRSAIPGETAMPENGDQLSSTGSSAVAAPPWPDD